MSEFDWNTDDVFSIPNGGPKNGSTLPPQEELPAEPHAEDAAASQSEGLNMPAADHPVPAAPADSSEIAADEQAPAGRAESSENPSADSSAPYAGTPYNPNGAYRYAPYADQGCDSPASGSEKPQPVRPAVGTERPKTERVMRKKRSGGFGKKIVALALVCALLGGIVGAGGFWLVSRSFGSPSGNSAVPTATDPTGKVVALQQGSPRDTNAVQTVQVERGQAMTASQVYKANVNSTVGITTEIVSTNSWGFQSTGAAAGSGFILTEDGYILTNQHVIDKASSITVAMYDGTTYDAELVGYDGNNDIAVLKIDAKGLTPVVLGDSEQLEVGDEVIAIGNPLGELTFSLTKGNVSALNRAVTLSSKVTMNLIQTDAAINSGNSGGALFNMYGEVIGITNAKYSTSSYSGEASIDNIGFAIPINSVRDIVTSIIEKGYISKPYIGVSVGNVSEESQSYGMPQGCAIRSVEENSPAAAAGLQANDIVTAVNGTEITSYEEFAQLITDSGIGAELELTVYRRGETLTLKVTVGEKIQDALPDPAENAAEEQQQGQSGENVVPWGGNGSDPWGGGFPWGWGFGW